MTDIAYEPAGLDRMGDRFTELSEDAREVVHYWNNHALPLADAAGKGIPALGLPHLRTLTADVANQTEALEEHIETVAVALHDTATMYRGQGEKNIDEVRRIFSDVPVSSNEEGRTSAGLSDDTIPSHQTLHQAPVAADMRSLDLCLAITTALRDLESEQIVFGWIDRLLGTALGERPTEQLLTMLTGDWEALSKVSHVFSNYAAFTDLMQGTLIHGGKNVRTVGQWEGPAFETAFERICANANKLDGLEEIWQDAAEKFQAWADASYVLLGELQENVALLPGLVVRAKKAVWGIRDIAVIGIDIIVNTAEAKEKVWQLLQELAGVVMSILAIIKRSVQLCFWILQALYAAFMTARAALSGSADLDRAW